MHWKSSRLPSLLPGLLLSLSPDQKHGLTFPAALSFPSAPVWLHSGDSYVSTGSLSRSVLHTPTYLLQYPPSVLFCVLSLSWLSAHHALCPFNILFVCPLLCILAGMISFPWLPIQSSLSTLALVQIKALGIGLSLAPGGDGNLAASISQVHSFTLSHSPNVLSLPLGSCVPSFLSQFSVVELLGQNIKQHSSERLKDISAAKDGIQQPHRAPGLYTQTSTPGTSKTPWTPDSIVKGTLSHSELGWLFTVIELSGRSSDQI